WLVCGLRNPAAHAQQPQLPCEITVNVRSGDGSPLDVASNVSLYFFMGGSALNVVQARAGQVVFRNLSPARYTGEVMAAGYPTATQPVDLQIAGQGEIGTIELLPRPTAQPSSTSPIPVLAPNARKELEKVLADLRMHRMVEARKRLEKTSRSAPSYPDVN